MKANELEIRTSKSDSVPMHGKAMPQGYAASATMQAARRFIEGKMD
jgi:hypothetical protein